MKAPITISFNRLRYGLVVAVVAASSAVALSACGGGASTSKGELTQARRQAANHVHDQERLRRLETRLQDVKSQTKSSRVVPIPTYVPSGTPTISDGTYYAPSADAPSSGSCGGELSVNSDTSCPFAAAVESAYFAEVGSGPGTVVAYSPVTDKTYVMSCSGSPHECTGGDHAAVYFP
jgi:hypothetical protein